ncbi:hypothetical protein QBC36DRAFT_111689 [Triangularia setosa]|uniref:Uncharacterized protein n=1 Tax=Triangularia setosa TaxID=2587417 RepID=A0AAN6VW74_9PEZI|nr:hypothetical protein QBC36DRAFT_111689 [Podospora setosa]
MIAPPNTPAGTQDTPRTVWGMYRFSAVFHCSYQPAVIAPFFSHILRTVIVEGHRRYDDDFFSDAKECPITIYGRGQTVYWWKSHLYVYRAGNNRETIQQEELGEGQGELAAGFLICFIGKDGRVKEA